MKRKAFYYFVYIFAPCLLASILMIMIFVLPPECGERMVVGITSMLALTVFFLLAAKNIPETSEDIPIMGRYGMFINRRYQVLQTLVAEAFS